MKSAIYPLAMLLLCSCASPPPAETAKEQPKQYSLHGEVVRLDAQNKTATINARKIEGWMEAMSMEYPVKDSQDFSTLHPSDCIDAKVWVQGADYWVTDVKHAPAAPEGCLAPKTDTKKNP